MYPKLSDLKPGDKIQTYCMGCSVTAVVTYVDPSGEGVCYAHEPVSYGKEEYTSGQIVKSTPLQAKYYNVITPAAYFNGEPLTIDGNKPIYTTL